MAYDNPGKLLSFKSGAAVNVRRFVKGDGTNAEQIVQSAAEGDLTIGVSYTGVDAAGKQVVVMTDGVAEVLAGGTIAAWGPVEPDANGKAVAAAGAGAFTCGQALRAAVDGDIVPVLLATPVAKGPANS